jgi:AcrR family transcriptional regulator
VSTSIQPPGPSQSPRARRRIKARLDIARAALELFRRKGYEETTVADIARAADFGERTFYRYFATKEEVVFFDIEHLLSEVRAAISDVPAGTALWDAIRTSVVASIERFQEPGQEFAAEVLRTWMADPALAGPFLRFCARWHEVLAEGWSRGYGTGDPADDLDAQLVAHCVVSTCQACFRVHVRTGQDLRELLERGFDRVEHGLGEFGPTPRQRSDGASSEGHRAACAESRASS